MARRGLTNQKQKNILYINMRNVIIILSVIVIILGLADCTGGEAKPTPTLTPTSTPKTTKVIPGEGEKGIGVSGSYPAFTIDECIEHSDTIVIGKVTEILPARWGKSRMREIIYQDVIIQTERYLYGEPEFEFIAVCVWGGKVGDTYMITDSEPLFTVGERTLLCLHRPPEELMQVVPEGIDPRSYYRVTAGIPGKYDFIDGILTDYKGQTTSVATFEEKIAAASQNQ
jgi:hypothetical protein